MVEQTNDRPWTTGEKPPNEVWVEVQTSAGEVLEAQAFYGRDGYRPHWQLRDGSACHPSTFSRWRHLTSKAANDFTRVLKLKHEQENG